MPELPEVQTTTRGLQETIIGLVITDVWTDLAQKNQKIPHFKDTLKSDVFYTHFRTSVRGQRVVDVTRRAKNILIHLKSGATILIHMKMTGHLLYGKYSHNTKTNTWAPSRQEKNDALRDPFNRFIHVVFVLSNKKHLALCDSRKFAKVTLLTKESEHHKHTHGIGPEPLENDFTLKKCVEQLKQKLNGKIKQVLLDQTIIAGIGNIYSDEMLWLAGIHPERRVSQITSKEFALLYTSMRNVLSKGIDFGGDSMSDYRRIDGTSGSFHHQHNVYRKTGTHCGKKGCRGVIMRKVVGGRSAHFCSLHQV